eukprot:TRINITY_DN9093_c0_g1_i1.p1 TRINITY_DN9093_c0_g1~~TRINITY_DN9093_c0_g1_i1.p1  ORF type:complete len:116 (+),score=12.07 TRINITY_DN9093_c0_g1_i1:59-406(+)
MAKKNHKHKKKKPKKTKRKVEYHLKQGETIRIERDYSNGTLTQYSEQMPEQLIDIIDEEQFNFTLAEINAGFRKAENTGLVTCMEGFIGCLTFFSIFFCIDSHFERVGTLFWLPY